MDTQKLMLVLLAKIAGIADPETYVNLALAVPVHKKAVAFRKVEPVEGGKKRVTIQLVDGSKSVKVE